MVLNDGSLGEPSRGGVETTAGEELATSSVSLMPTGADCALLHAPATMTDVTLIQIERETEACHRRCGVLPRVVTPLRYILTLRSYSR